jgi:hypothetical protein
MMSGSSVSTEAIIIGRAAFLLPLKSTVPRNGTPPRMSILSIRNQPPPNETMATETSWSRIVPKRGNEGTRL